MKKTILRKVLCILLACVLMSAAAFPAFAGTPAEDAHLHFNEDGKFRVLNFSDFQDGQTLDSRVKSFIRRAVYDALPDLIVLTGDNIYGRRTVGRDQVQTAIAQFMDIFEELGVPVAITFGNHDDNGNSAAKETQMAIYNSYSVSISYDEGSSMSGCGTYNIPIYGSTQTDRVKFNLWMLDTGSLGGISAAATRKYDGVQTDQLDWYVSKSNALKTENGGNPVPSIAFQHIIVPEIYSALDVVSADTPGARKHDGQYYALPDTAAPGSILGEAPSPTVSDRYCGEFSRMKLQGDVLAIVCGHDHRNMFEIPYQGINLICTPTAGYYSEFDYASDPEGVDPLVRGARIIDIDESGGYTTSMLLMRDLNRPKPQYYVPTSAPDKYVKNVALCVAQSAKHGGSTQAAMAAAYRHLYNAVDAAHGNGVAVWADLNSDVGHYTLDQSPDNHWVICMGYTLTDNPAEAMRGLGLSYDGSYPTSYDDMTAQNLLWNLCCYHDLFVRGTTSSPSLCDLNCGTTGKPIYFFANYGSSGSPLTQIRIVNTGADTGIKMADYPDDHLAYAVFGSETGPDVADLNKTAWGDYIYALYRTSDDSMKPVRLETQLLLQTRFNAFKRLKELEKTYGAEALAPLQSALAHADAILRDLNDDNETSVYDQTALDAAAYRIVNCMQNLEEAAFTVTFNANGGTCGEQSRTIVSGDFCGELPVAKRSRIVNPPNLKERTIDYHFDGWYTERTGGVQITPETIFTAASDQTWYAHWSLPGSILPIESPDDPWKHDEPQDSVEIVGGGDDRDQDIQKHVPDKADVNADGAVDLKDITLLMRHLSGGWNVEIEVANADVNADGNVDLRDAVLMRRYLAGGWDVVLA